MGALEVAVAHGDLEEVIARLDQEPSLLHAHFPENVGLTPLMWACRNRRDSIVRELLARGANVDVTNTREAVGDGGNTALWFAAQGLEEGTVGIANLLLDHGAQINVRCEHGTTAFYMAASWVHLDLAQSLIARGADPLIPNDQGETPSDMVRRQFRWCAEQKRLEPPARKFLERAPRMIAFLASVAAH